MTELIWDMLYQLILGPLTLLFEAVYGFSFNILNNCGAAIIPLSLTVNFLLLPFYLRADAIQREEQELQKRLAPGVARIKKCFSGDMQYMTLQTYYRENHYKPYYSLRSALPLLLQVPFFIAAYRFLSTLPDLRMAQFGPLRDLSAPDGLLQVGGLSVNVLPILMTAINILSSEIYSKGSPLKDKLRLYGFALLFLIILYASPSGLVFYWTLNNLFSLFKNLVCSAKRPRAAVSVTMSALGALILIYVFAFYHYGKMSKLILIFIGLLCQLPALWYGFGLDKRFRARKRPEAASDPRLFLMGCVFLSVLTGLMIPSSVVRSSPAEFVIVTDYHSPLLIVLFAFLLALGTFLLWPGLLYYLIDSRVRRSLEAAVWILCGTALVNALFFGVGLGNLSSEMEYEVPFSFSRKQLLVNAAVLLAVAAVLLLLWLRRRKLPRAILAVLILAGAGLSAVNVAGIQSALPQIKAISQHQKSEEKASFTLSREGRNVIVFMLDRGISAYVPYMFQENPELAAQFDGFTWYPNTLSFGTRTNTASPALFGGYEYTPEELNRRSKEWLADKHNEALKVMPVLFSQAGYEVTLCDPPYAGYSWVPDLSVFDGLPGVRTYNTELGEYNRQEISFSLKKQIWKRCVFCYSFMKISPLLLQEGLYQGGTYFNPQKDDPMMMSRQRTFGRSSSRGIRDSYLDRWFALCALPEMTQISSGEQDAFLMMQNEAAHDVMLLEEPAYEPALFVDNTEYDDSHEDRFTFRGRKMIVDTAYQMSHYQCNMASFLQLGKWFDYLRSQGVYDNTRIILVSDHGWSLEQFPDMVFGSGSDTIYNPEDVMAYNPLLMVKDFGQEGFSVDNRFMTNADVPTLATEGLIEDPRNPFTGSAISSEAKNEPEHHVFYTDEWGTEKNNGKTFLPGIWYSLKGQNIFDMESWEKLREG